MRKKTFKGYLYVKEKLADVRNEFEHIITIDFKGVNVLNAEDLNNLYPVEKRIKIVEDYHKAHNMMQNKPRATTTEALFVEKQQSKWASGEYYAHEYDQYAHGRVRKVKYSNGFEEFEVQCLDPRLKVLDGYWQEHNNNGCGDTFELTERRTW